MSKNLYPDSPPFVFKKSFILAVLLLVSGLYSGTFAQCPSFGVETDPQLVTPSNCINGQFKLGSGAYIFLTVSTNTYYNWTFNNGSGCVNGFCAIPQNGNATTFSANTNGWFSGTTTSLLVIANRNGCFNSTSAVMTYRYSTPSITAINASPNSICQGSTLNLTSTSSDAAGLTWAGPSFSGSGNNTSVTNIQTGGVFTFTANNSGCSVSASTSTVTVNPPATANAGANQTTCSSAGAVSITGASVANNSGISWGTSGGGSFSNTGIINPTYTPNAADIAAGSVTLTLTAIGNAPCGNATSSKTLFITGAPTANAGGNQTSCSNSGPVTITGASATNTGAGFTWTTSGTGSFTNGSTLSPSYTPSPGDLSTGSVTITLTVNASSPCSQAISSKTITFTPAPTVSAGGAQSTCSNSGAFTLTGASAANYTTLTWVTGGDGTFSNTGILSPTYTPGANDLANGSVTLTLGAGGNGPCTAVSSTKLITITAAPVVSAGGNQTTCSSAGAVSITGASASNDAGVSWTTSGTGNFTNGNTLTPSYTPSPGDITSGSVTLTLTATGNSPCANGSSSKTLTIISAPAPNAGGDQSTCSNSGTVNITGASAPNATGVNWTSNGSGTFTGANTLTPTYTPSPADISAGSVVLTLTASGTAPCNSVAATKNLTIVTAPTVNAGPALFTCANSGTVNVSGASASNYSTLLWSTSGSGTFVNSAALVTGYTPSAADTVAGSVTLTLTANGNGPCASASSSLLLTINPLPTGSITGTTSICTGSSATLTFNLGTANPFDIVYTDGTNNYSANGVSNGYTAVVSPTANSTTYLLTSITDNNGCTRPSNFLGGATISVTQLPVISSVTPVPALCFGTSTGSITITATGGSPGYTYSIDSGVTFQNSNVFNNLPAGNDYVLKVSDTHGCTSFYANNDVTITQPALLTQTDSSVTASCANVFDGSITVYANGGTPPYHYSLNGGPSQTGTTFGNLGAGTYVVDVTDFNGCSDTTHVTITNSYIVSDSLLSQTNVSCFGGTDGAMTVQITGGVPPYSYSDNGVTFQSSPTFTGLTAGNYVVTLRDSRGCTDFLQVSITQPGLLDIVIDSLANVACSGSSGGAIFLTINGGTTPYTFNWSNGATTQNVTNLTAGTYNVTVLDAHGCNASSGATITQPLPLFLNVATVHNLSCYNDSSGFIYVSANGGVPPYNYTWSNGATTQDISGLSIGTYVLTVVDANSCSATISQDVTQPTQLTSTISSGNVTCSGAANGSVTFNVSGGASPYAYLWSNGATTQSLSNVSGGTYSVVATDANGCSISNVITVVEPAAIVLDISSTPVSCNGGTNGTVTTTVTGGTGTIVYSWSNGATTANLTGVPAGPYTVNITDFNNCSASASVTVIQPTALVLNGTVANVSCSGGSNGSVSITVNGGVFPYTYVWSNGATTQDINGVAATTYIVTATDANLCTITASFDVTAPSAITSSVAGTDVTCHGEANGTATLTVNGGTTPYSFLWSNFQSAQNLSGLSGGTYYVIITDANGCTHRDSVIINEPAAIVLSISSTDVSCNGGSNGTVTTTVSGGTGQISYAWSNGATTANLNGVVAGPYSVTITDANLCTASASVTISQPTALVLNGTVANVSCSGGNNGSVQITVNGGVFPYSYAWSNGATTQNINALIGGTYIVTATDANLCTITATFDVNSPTAITSSVAGTNVTCHGQANGTATLSVNGGTPPYSFLWNTFQATQNLTGLSGGTYYVIITDANGCEHRDSVIISEPAAIVLTISSTDVSCNGGSNGTVTTTVSGGTGNITYAWSNGATTANLNGVAAGPYSVVITDANLCTASASVTISQPTALVLNGTVANVSCSGGSNGSVSITVNGGVFPYSYAWSNGATTQDINGVTASTYIVTVTDANLCTITATFDVTSPSPITSSIAGTDVTCHGEANGTATLTVGGGTPPYSYAWSTFQATQNLTGLSGGTYYVIITDANGCTHRDSVIIHEPGAIVLTIASTDVTCNGGNNGTVTTNVSGGTGTITYAWSNGATTANLNGVIAGTYTVVITDANSCTASASATVSQPTPLLLNGTVANVTCSGGNNGSVAITIYGGVVPYTFAWSNGATTQDINGLTGGTYLVTVTDANLCTITATFDVNAPSAITSSITGTNVTCHGAANGTATLTVSGGTPGYTFFWSNFQATQNVSGLSGGTYYVIITDANGCDHRDSVTITEPTAIVLSLTSTNVSCNGGANGTITTTASGGTGTLTYLWSNGATTANLTGLTVGTYVLVVTDANNCTATDSATITQPTALVLNGTAANVGCFGGNNGSIQVTVNGGVAPYSYAWSNGATTQNVNGLSGGVTYIVTATDANSCTVTASFTITSPAALVTTISGTDVSCHGANDGTATISTSGGTPPYSNLWSNFQGSSTITNLSGGLYYVIVTDGNGCTKKDSIQINEPTQIVVTSTVTQITCFNANNGAINLTVTGGDPGYTYVWSPTLSGNANQPNLGGGNYSVTVTDTHSCSVSAEITLVNPPAIAINSVVSNPKCFGDSNGVINLIVSGGAPAYTYQWNVASDSTANVNNAAVGTYYVTVTDSRGCAKTDSAIVATPSQLYTSGVIKNVSCAGNRDGDVLITVYGGTLPYSYQWSNLQSTQDIYNLPGGNYFVTVTDANLCKVASLYIVHEPAQLTLGIAATNVSCFGGNNGTLTSLPGGGTQPYRYIWSNVSSDSIQTTNITAGLYGLQLVDSNGCYAFDSVIVTQPTPVSITGFVNNVVCFNTATGSVVTIVTGGTPGYHYAWSNGGVDSAINTVSAGVYIVTVTDAANCNTTADFTVTQGTKVNIDLATYDPICYAGNTGAITALVTGGTQPYHFAWSNGAADTAVAIDHLLAGIYVVTVTDNVGCNVTASGTLNQPAIIALNPSITGARCTNTANGVIIINTTGGTSPFNYSLNGLGQTSDTFSHVLPGRYEVIVTDVNGCQGTDTFSISTPNNITVSLTVNDPVIVTGMETQLSATATSNSPIVHYIWSPIAVDSADVFDYVLANCPDSSNCSAPYVKPPYTTVFMVTAVDADSCSASDTVTVYVHGEQGLEFMPTAFSPNGDGLNDRFTFAILGATTIDITIFDRWGEMVYHDGAQPNGISSSYGWDGTKGGKEAPIDTYVYQLKVTYFDNTVKTKTGTVAIVR